MGYAFSQHLFFAISPIFGSEFQIRSFTTWCLPRKLQIKVDLKNLTEPEETDSRVLNAVCLLQFLFPAAGRSPGTRSLAKRWAWDSCHGRTVRLEERKATWRESGLARAACRRGDS